MRASINRPPTPEADEEPERELTLPEMLNIKEVLARKLIETDPEKAQVLYRMGTEFQQLVESGEKEKLKELLRERLIECGWRDEMKAICRDFAKKKGRNNITVDELVQVITPKGRAAIPDSVKAELLQRIRAFLTSAAL